MRLVSSCFKINRVDHTESVSTSQRRPSGEVEFEPRIWQLDFGTRNGCADDQRNNGQEECKRMNRSLMERVNCDFHR